ncbi:PREDICTED: uncharacterized protein LOC105152810 isoform X2 [Acromyrmex echinatior]|uniref:Uncharacterized protein n=1 Tax=Acromyrmex echinatior TaxID=103372 RepID=F4X4T2_ACREC|nr:PREDICTED: uncharacterized protein LOC105152810 isoform X2 [Acromyrmex echinatior]EGI58505.1 hypothetical protein G5I_13354 [Acromyrmex echinatior]
MRPSAGVARRAAIPRDPGDPGVRSRIDPEGAEVDIKRVYAASPTIEPTYDIEWIRSDLADIEISKFVSGIAGSKSTASRNNPRRYYRTSTSSGYSSHSPPLSAGSYSYYASASTRDPSYGSLAVIHESEAIPRPIWPSIIYHHTEDRSAGGYEGIYTCHVCGCTYKYSPSQPQLISSKAHEVLLELSQTLNSVIDGNVTAPPEDILRDISRIVSLEIGTRNDNVYEYICPSWAFSDKNPTVSPSCVKNVPSKVNPINSKLCVSPRCLYEYNSARSAPSLKNDRTTRREGDSDMRNKSSLARKKPCATESKYSLVCSDVGSSVTEGTIASLSANNWNHRLAGGLGEDFDFTLDVTQVERLGRTIARAKRKRQWCRALTTLFGLVFFVLSVVVVSLSVTRGRKVFGSM